MVTENVTITESESDSIGPGSFYNLTSQNITSNATFSSVIDEFYTPLSVNVSNSGIANITLPSDPQLIGRKSYIVIRSMDDMRVFGWTDGYFIISSTNNTQNSANVTFGVSESPPVTLQNSASASRLFSSIHTIKYSSKDIVESFDFSNISRVVEKTHSSSFQSSTVTCLPGQASFIFQESASIQYTGASGLFNTGGGSPYILPILSPIKLC